MAVGALVALATAVAAVTADRQWHRLPGVLAMASALLLLSVQFGALTGIRPAAVEQMAALVHEHRQADEPVGTYRVFVRNLGFYSGVRQAALFDDDATLDFLQAPDRVLLVLPEADLARLQSLVERPLARLASVPYVDTAGIRLGTLLGPDPARHVETVVLVSNR
jgi:hypothetical protein